MREGVLDGESHVRGAELGLQGAVDELDGRVHDALRMDDDVDRVVVDIVQPVCLDDLQALVRERGRVDRDLGPHRPRRMAQRHGGRDGVQAVRRIEERPAGRGEHEAADGGHRLADEALPDRGVLGIDRAQPGQRDRERIRGVCLGPLGRTGACLAHDEVAARDQRFLVGGRDDLAAPQRREHRPQRDDAARAHDHEIDVLPGRDRLEGVIPADPSRSGREVERRGVVGQAHDGGPQPRRLRAQLVRVASARERDDAEPVGVLLEDVHRLTADAPGRAQQGDAGPRTVSAGGRGHTGRRAGPRTGTSPRGRGCRRAPGSASPSPWRRRRA